MGGSPNGSVEGVVDEAGLEGGETALNLKDGGC